MTVLRNGRLIATRDKAGLARKELVSLMLGKEFSEDVLAPVAASAPVGEPRFKFSGVGKKGKIKPFDLDVHAGEVVGLAGLLGAGRTETAEVLFGARAADSGEIIVDGAKVSVETPQDAIGLGFGFCPEDRKLDGIVGDLSVRENIVLALQARQGWAKPLSRNDQNALADKYIAALDIRTEGREKPIKLLSGGNQQKVMLARWLATEPRFLILDEPTRGIDVGAHAEIIRLIRELCAGGMSLLVISSEIEELIAYSSRIRVLRDHEHVAELSAGQMTASAIVNAIAASTTEGDRS
jgi:simple sugar transport system ATP-binding protein